VQRYACDSAISRITGQSELEPELNHASRTLRRRPGARSKRATDTVSFRAASRPLIWCDGHHLVWWTRGGATALPNLALLCRPHHRMVHEEGWSLSARGMNGVLRPPGNVAMRRLYAAVNETDPVT